MAAPMHGGVAIAAPIDAAALGWHPDSDRAQEWGDYRRHRRHRDGISGGDILAGILVIGGIAAIASAASKKDRDRRYEERDYRSENRRYEDRPTAERDDDRYDRGTGDMELAINACFDAAERQAGDDARVSAVQSVVRDGAGWRVEGELANSDQRTFLCGTSEGRVDFVQLGNDDRAFAN